jgi:hypothetical protein
MKNIELRAALRSSGMAVSEQFEQISGSAYTLLLACKQMMPLGESSATV